MAKTDQMKRLKRSAAKAELTEYRRKRIHDAIHERAWMEAAHEADRQTKHLDQQVLKTFFETLKRTGGDKKQAFQAYQDTAKKIHYPVLTEIQDKVYAQLYEQYVAEEVEKWLAQLQKQGRRT